MAKLDYDAFDVLTFDCYGTLIDWEAGLVAALRRALGDAAAALDDDELLARFAALEHDAQADGARYRDVLVRCLHAIAGRSAPTSTTRRRRRSAARSPTGRPSPTRPRRSRSCTRASRSLRSRTATTTCSRPRRRSSASRSTSS